MARIRRSAVLALLVAGAIVVAIAVAASRLRPAEAPLGPAGPIVPVPVPSGAAVLVGAGDIARCTSDMDEATARLVDAVEGTVFTLGDNAYERGTEREFRECYGPTWGRHRDRTLPVPGNHDWETEGAAGYVAYFGDAARPNGETWYAVEVGAWRVTVLDSDCEHVGGCDEGSDQVAWLERELAASHAACTLALWHHPRFSSGQHGNDERLTTIWRLLADAGAEVVLSGHDHDYERFAPQDGDATRDDPAGMRQFVVGTGGTGLRPFDEVVANSEVRDATTHGVLRLVLWPDRYEWQFLPVADRDFRDEGQGRCH